MTLGNSTKTLFLSSSLLACVVLESKTQAGFVRIINTSESSIRAEVISEPVPICSTYCWKCVVGSRYAASPHSKEIKILPEALGNQKYYSIVGSDGGILFQGRCKNLNVTKNYEISFFDTTFGLSCQSKEI